MSTPDDRAARSARFADKLARLAELMPPDQFDLFLSALDWALDASLAGASEDDIAFVFKRFQKPGSA